MQEKEKKVILGWCRRPDQDRLSVAVTERETKPHSARKSNKEIAGYETWLSLPSSSLSFYRWYSHLKEERERQILVLLPPYTSSAWEVISRSRVKESCRVEEEWNSCLCSFLNGCSVSSSLLHMKWLWTWDTWLATWTSVPPRAHTASGNEARPVS